MAASPKSKINLSELESLLTLAKSNGVVKLSIPGFSFEFAQSVQSTTAKSADVPADVVPTNFHDPLDTPISEDEALYWASGFDPNAKSSEDEDEAI